MTNSCLALFEPHPFDNACTPPQNDGSLKHRFSEPAGVEAERLYLDHRALIERVITGFCRRQRLSRADADEFGGIARLHLVDHDYAVLRKFQGESTLQSYLVAVFTHLYLDWRNAAWGKWRPSAEARRAGPLALHLERLTVRDGMSFEEACEVLRTNHRVTESPHELEALAERLPSRQRRRFESADALTERPSAEALPDRQLERRDAEVAARDAAIQLRQAIDALDAEDRLIIRMRFENGLKVVEIARALGLDQKQLYRHIERLLIQLRTALERAGVSRLMVKSVLDTEPSILSGEDPVPQTEYKS
jgi:RNA polymerase sigma factor for flagellar operon FliA